MMNAFTPPVALALVDIGRVVSLVLIGGGLLWLLIRAIKLKEVERRVIFLFIFISVAAPILFPTVFKEKATPVVKAVFDKIESLPPGSHVLLSYDFDPAMAPEVQPMADAFSRHCLVKGHKVIFMCLFATGQGQFTRTMENVIRPEFPEKIDGVDLSLIHI